MWQKNGFLVALVCLWSSVCLGQGIEQLGNVSVGFRHIIMLQPGIDQVQGSYMFGVQNKNSDPTTAKFPVMLPKEVVDFGPQGGVAPSELTLEEGKLFIEKEFKPGLNLVGVGFVLNSKGGSAEMTLEPKQNIDELNVVTKADSMVIDAPNFQLGLSAMLQNSGMKGILNKEAVKKGETLIVSLSGLPLGRSHFWLLGWILVAIIIAGASFGVWRTYSDVHEHSGAEMLAGE